ncbi:MAG: ABC transporter substrate-binding protein, partial [Thermoleophilia bacterium]|nr:ABC transporter substrate-binding protein [Thermoleophilia bacterium]
QGYKLVDGGSFQPGTEDFSSVISAFKKGGAELCGGLMSPPDFTNFWKQAAQQGYKPKIATIGKALLFNQVVEALGEIALNLSTPAVWTPVWPYKSSLTGETCREFSDEYERRTGVQWSQLLEQYANFEVAVDVLKRTEDIDDKESILAALKTTKITTIQGPVDFTAPVDPQGKRPVPNVYKTAVATGQWVKGNKWPFDLLVVGNAGWPDIPVETELKLLA